MTSHFWMPKAPRGLFSLRRRALLAVTLLVVLPAIFAVFSLDRREPTDLQGWTKLVLNGRKFLIARGTAEIERWPGAERRPEPGGAPAPDLPEMLRVESSARVLGRSVSRFHVVSLARPGGALLEWFAWNEGKKARRVRLEEGESGAALRVARYRPAGEAAAWILDRQQVLPFELPPESRGLPPIDPYGVMGRLGELVSRREGNFLLVSRKGPIEVAFEASAPEEQTFRLRDQATGDRVSLDLKVSRVMLRPAGGAGRTLLDMEGATELWVDAGSGALLRISGHSPKIRGVITLRVSSFSKARRPRPSVTWPPFASETTLLDGNTEAP